ncbi:HD domain-containing protein [candidate division KSB1 bacterium]|nr:HD domain-containing protein [candidate division KSB1 bacterium]
MVTPKLIQDLQPGDQVLAFFVVRKKEFKTKKDGAPYLLLELGDRSGRIRGNVWDEVSATYSTLEIGGVAKVKGLVTTFDSEININIEKIRPTNAQDQVDFNQFLPQTRKDVRVMTLRLFAIIDSLSHQAVKRLLKLIFDDIDLKNKFTRAPAAKLWHQNYLGGLLEHTLQVTEICDKVISNYDHVNRDILMAGALLHDIGKIHELSLEGFIDYSDQGRLISHTILGYQLVATKISQLPELPETIGTQILHLILSHHGQQAQGAPVVPMTLEAMILHGADYLDSQASAFNRIIQNEKEPGKKWSKYVNLIDRYIYFGDESI